jgi:outer membrane immunogenic protein
LQKFSILFAVLAFSGSAYAADMVVKAPPPPPAPPAYSWTGCFLGGNVGGIRAHKTWTDAVTNQQVADYNIDGWLGGAQVGCDYQTPSHFVIGLQGDYDGTTARGSGSNPTTNTNHNTTITSLASVTGRLGYSIGQFLGYARGGGAWEHDGYSTAGVIDTQASQTRTGWTAGLGVEYAFTRYLSGFVEYDHYDFGTNTVPFMTRIGTTFHFTISESKNVFKAGLNLRFDGAPLQFAGR